MILNEKNILKYTIKFSILSKLYPWLPETFTFKLTVYQFTSIQTLSSKKTLGS